MFTFFQLLGTKTWWMVIFMTAGALPSSNGVPAPVVAGTFPTQVATPEGTTEEKSLSPKECVEEAARLQGTWSSKEKTVSDLLKEAKKTKNVIRQNCIEPKAASVTFWIGEGKSSLADMKSGLSQKSSADRMALLLQKVKVIDSNIEEQVMEAGRCIGDEQFSAGDGLEMKLTQPENDAFDPDAVLINLNDPLGHDSNYVVTNPDWSVELTWPTASPYR